LVKSSGAYNTTMTVTESSCRMTSTVSARERKQQSTNTPFRGFSAERQTSPVGLAGERSVGSRLFSGLNYSILRKTFFGQISLFFDLVSQLPHSQANGVADSRRYISPVWATGTARCG